MSRRQGKKLIELREREASEKRARDALVVRQQLAAELEKRRVENQTSNAAPNKAKETVHHKAKANKRGRKPREPRCNTRHKGQKKFEAQVEEERTTVMGPTSRCPAKYVASKDKTNWVVL
ncbi:hypothetical protein RchiOBHm_Chr5g0036611 [Rosa chinensis]|uniref:Uncharacterized protein n=1 Tax=Rosa chinensis TaxID=74649 RepID=A0A2P6QBK0_ROSCH|nr:hypothetical protein RchiOBHm_Chr5g0036611 [Rosa chinensis]